MLSPFSSISLMDIDGLNVDETAEFVRATYEEERKFDEDEDMFYDALEQEQAILMHDGWFNANADEWEQEIAAQEWAMRQNHIDVEEMVDAIVGNATCQSYLDDNFSFMKWCLAEKPGWVTEFGSAQLARLEEEAEGMQSRKQCRHVR